MRHGRGTNFTGFDFQFEIIEGNIKPEIAAKINNNGIDTFHAIKSGTNLVVVGDLSGELFTNKAKHFRNESIRE